MSLAKSLGFGAKAVNCGKEDNRDEKERGKRRGGKRKGRLGDYGDYLYIEGARGGCEEYKV